MYQRVVLIIKEVHTPPLVELSSQVFLQYYSVASNTPSGGKVIEKASHYINHLLPVFIWTRLRGSRVPFPQHISRNPLQRTHQTRHGLMRWERNGIYVNGGVKLAPGLRVSPWNSCADGCYHNSFIQCDMQKRRGEKIHMGYRRPEGPEKAANK